jgi:Ca-activated chloride channel family protein
MKLGRLIVVFVAVAAVIVLVLAGRDGDDDGGSGEAPANAPEGAVEVSFAYSPEKEELLEPLIDEFNGSGAEVDGAPVFVSGEVVSSGEAEQKIAAGELQPVAWSPASSLWGRLLNFEADRELTAEDVPSIVRTPLVIAMWEPLAQALGYPNKEIGFEDILALARPGAGWASVGHPEFGDFKLVHTNPDFSTSGLSAVVAEYYAATGKREGLLEADIDGKARQTVRDIEQSIVHYGDTTLFVADQMREGGPSYASAVAMEEVTLLDFNRDRAGQPSWSPSIPRRAPFSPTIRSSSSTESGSRRPSARGPRPFRTSSPMR